MQLLLRQSSEQACRPCRTHRNQMRNLPPTPMDSDRPNDRTAKIRFCPRNRWTTEDRVQHQRRRRTQRDRIEAPLSDASDPNLRRRYPIETRFPGLAAEVHGPRRGRRRSCARRVPVRVATTTSHVDFPVVDDFVDRARDAAKNPRLPNRGATGLGRRSPNRKNFAVDGVEDAQLRLAVVRPVAIRPTTGRVSASVMTEAPPTVRL